MEIKDIRRANLALMIRMAGSQADLASRAGTSPAYLSQIVNGTPSASGTPREVGSKLARRLELACQLPAGWMDRVHSEGSDGVDDQPPEAVSGANSLIRHAERGAPARHDEVHIKESEVSFRGGPGHDLTYEIVEESEPATYRLSWFQKERINPEKVIRFRQVGDSNEPFLYSGDTILVNLDESDIRNGKVYAFWQDGEGRRCKKLFRKADGTVHIHSFNPMYPEEVLNPETAARDLVIIGRVRDRSGRGGL